VTDQTRVLNQTIALGDNPDDIHYDQQNGHGFIVLGGIQIAVSLTSQASLDKLATVTAQAAADNRGRTLRTVA
jgi:hydroxymethylpyrimidine pyrophosphatase-like HAD family hydrolase